MGLVEMVMERGAYGEGGVGWGGAEGADLH